MPPDDDPRQRATAVKATTPTPEPYPATRHLHCPHCDRRYRIDADSEDAFADGIYFHCGCGMLLEVEDKPEATGDHSV